MSGIAQRPAAVVPSAGLLRRSGWALMLLLALGIALYAALVLLLPGFGPPFVAERRAAMPLVVIGHLAGGVLAMVRIWLPLWIAGGMPFGRAYQAVAWVCWVPNLVVAEWLVLPRYRGAA